MERDKTIGAITWMDITVPEADGLRDFYKNVVGWTTMDISMGDYNDYCMVSPTDNVVRSGVCHAAGSNAGMPAAWIMYINVANLDESIAKVIAGGGEVVNGRGRWGRKHVIVLLKILRGRIVGCLITVKHRA